MSKPSPKLLDVVIQVSSGSLDFLERWRAVLAPYHIIVVQTSGGQKLSVPAGLDVEVHTLSDAQKLCGADLWALSVGDSLSRSYGYMLSKKRYVYSIGASIEKVPRSCTDLEQVTWASNDLISMHADENCLIAKDPSGKDIDALQQHMTNLTSPATPFFFNTLYVRMGHEGGLHATWATRCVGRINTGT